MRKLGSRKSVSQPASQPDCVILNDRSGNRNEGYRILQFPSPAVTVSRLAAALSEFRDSPGNNGVCITPYIPYYIIYRDICMLEEPVDNRDSSWTSPSQPLCRSRVEGGEGRLVRLCNRAVTPRYCTTAVAVIASYRRYPRCNPITYSCSRATKVCACGPVRRSVAPLTSF